MRPAKGRLSASQSPAYPPTRTKFAVSGATSRQAAAAERALTTVGSIGDRICIRASAARSRSPEKPARTSASRRLTRSPSGMASAPPSPSSAPAASEAPSGHHSPPRNSGTPMRVGPLARCVARPRRATYSHVATRAPCRYSAPRSAACPSDRRTVWARPPIRSRASSTTNVRPASRRMAPAASPAAPAPTTTQSRGSPPDSRLMRGPREVAASCRVAVSVGLDERH